MTHLFLYHFFLGGHDAEMMEIKKILTLYGCHIHDANLTWGAKLSAYQNDLKKLSENEIPILIELEQDIPLPGRAIIIDHHGKLASADEPTAIEKIASLLNITLTRFQQLVSANDRGHVRGMLAMGATEKEIRRIRAYDRYCQGITPQDYQFAEEAVANLKELPPGIALIESKTKKTATIVDNIWDRYQTIIIKMPGEIHITGSGKLIEDLVSDYETLKEKNSDIVYWYGGMLPSYGFFGANYFVENDIMNTAIKNSKPVSQHVFLFPFRIESWEGCNVNLKEVFSKLTESGWEIEPFQWLDDVEKYNNYSYFYDYVRTAIFETTKERKPRKFKEVQKKTTLEVLFDGDEPQFVSCLLTRRRRKGNFKLFIKREVNGCIIEKSFELKIEKVSLRLFETSIAVLALELINDNYTAFSDIQLINDYGRRVYPQFLGKDCGKEIQKVKESFLADRIELHIEGDPAPFVENFEWCDFLCEEREYCTEWFQKEPRSKWADFVADKKNIRITCILAGILLICWARILRTNTA